MAQINPEIDHLFRRAGFGISSLEADNFRNMSVQTAISYLVDYEGRPDDVDERIGRPDHVQVTTKDLFAPDIDIEDARHRWLFRMIHTRRPLQEKMALFWHNHFATGYSKLAADSGTVLGAKMLVHKPGVLRGPQGQIELFRQYALGNFRNLLIEIAKDGDGGVARRTEQHEGEAAGELRPRNHRALHHRRRQLRRDRRLRRRPRVHRMEPPSVGRLPPR
jgi:hypothetical protein